MKRYKVNPDPPEPTWKRWRTSWVPPKEYRKLKRRQQRIAAKARAAKEAKAKGLQAPVEAVKAKKLSADEAEKLRQAKWRDLVEWVVKHMGEAVCPDGATAEAKFMWEIAKEDKRAFADRYLFALMKGEDPGQDKVDRGVKATVKECDEWLANFWKGQPVTARPPANLPA